MRNDSINTLVPCAMRYALGRSSYIVSMVCEEIINYKDKIRNDIKEQMTKEIYSAICNNRAGMREDVEDWTNVLHILSNDLRQKPHNQS